MEMGSEAATAVAGDLVAALEKATLMAKQLPNAAEPSQIRQIYATLHSTHHHLTMFLGRQSTPFPLPSFFFQPTTTLPPENSISGAAGDEDDTDEPMQLADDEAEAEQKSKNSLDGVEEKLRECIFIQNKKPKRELSPSAAAAEQQQRCREDEAVVRGCEAAAFDPQGTRLRALDLIYQFHS